MPGTERNESDVNTKASHCLFIVAIRVITTTSVMTASVAAPHSGCLGLGRSVKCHSNMSLARNWNEIGVHQ
jgi:hypothetical protein